MTNPRPKTYEVTAGDLIAVHDDIVLAPVVLKDDEVIDGSIDFGAYRTGEELRQTDYTRWRAVVPYRTPGKSTGARVVDVHGAWSIDYTTGTQVDETRVASVLESLGVNLEDVNLKTRIILTPKAAYLVLSTIMPAQVKKELGL